MNGWLRFTAKKNNFHLRACVPWKAGEQEVVRGRGWSTQTKTWLFNRLQLLFEILHVNSFFFLQSASTLKPSEAWHASFYTVELKHHSRLGSVVFAGL